MSLAVNVTQGTLLGGRVKYRQFEAGHRSGFEPVLLAAAIGMGAGERVLEVGCGAGAGLLCLGFRVPGIIGVGLEIAPALAALANENFKINGLNNVSCIVGDAASPPPQNFHHIMANPPWHHPASTHSPDTARALAHHAKPNLIATWLTALGPRLTPTGAITLILPAAALPEACTALHMAKLGGLTLLPIWPRAGQPAKQFIISARKSSKSPSRILTGLTLHTQSTLTTQAEAILRHMAPIPL